MRFHLEWCTWYTVKWFLLSLNVELEVHCSKVAWILECNDCSRLKTTDLARYSRLMAHCSLELEVKAQAESLLLLCLLDTQYRIGPNDRAISRTLIGQVSLILLSGWSRGELSPNTGKEELFMTQQPASCFTARSYSNNLDNGCRVRWWTQDVQKYELYLFISMLKKLQ